MIYRLNLALGAVIAMHLWADHTYLASGVMAIVLGFALSPGEK